MGKGIRWFACVFSAVMLLSLSPAGVVMAMPGDSQEHPAYSAKQIHTGNPSAPSGVYWLDPDGPGGEDPFQAYCDMATDGGGWTLGVNSLLGAESATTDMTSNTGTPGISTAHTRNLGELAVNQDAEIRHEIVDTARSAEFHAKYLGRYHDPMPVWGSWTTLSGHTSGADSILSYHFDRSWDASGSCYSSYGVPWYYGACWMVIPVNTTNGYTQGPERVSYGAIDSYSIWVRETTTPAGDFTPPSSAITSPSGGAFLNGTSITITGTAFDNISGTGVYAVEVTFDSWTTVYTATDTSGGSWATWSYDWTLPTDGCYNMLSRATDNSSNVETPGAGVMVNVDNTPPASGITDPVEGAAINGSSYTVTGTAGDGSGTGVQQVEVSVDGETWADATSAGPSWVFETIDSNGYTGLESSLALDGSGYAYISYYCATDYILRYATNASGTWVTATVDSDSTAGENSSIVLDGSGNAHVSYWAETAGELRYATNASGDWVITTVDADSTMNTGAYTSIALDGSGNAHISYHDWRNGDLQYATNASGEWVTSIADGTGDAGYYTSIALDGSGNAHISYVTFPSAELKYATNASGDWVTTTVDSTGDNTSDAGEYTSLSLDGSGNVHISYYDSTNEDLKYATNASGDWVTATVDSGGNVGEYASLVLDSSGDAFISYYDRTNGDIKLTTNASGDWVTTTVDCGGNVGEYTSLALDGSGNAHISYYDYTNGDLKYAGAVNPWDTWSYNWTYPASGTYTIKSRATDNAGNKESPGSGVTFTIDNTPPVSYITDPLNGATLSGTSYTITGTATDGSGSGVQTVEVSTDGGTNWSFANYTSGTWSYDWTFGANGDYNIRSRATDDADNVEIPGPGINVTVFNRTLTSPELNHYNWDASFSGGQCTACHDEDPGSSTFLPADFMDEPGFCRSCHNAAATAHDRGLTASRGHSVMASVTTAGCVTPTYGNITSGEWDNRPFAHLLDGDKIVCVTCHNPMRKTEDVGRVFEPASTVDRVRYTLPNGGWDGSGSYAPRVYRSYGRWTNPPYSPTYSKDKKDYLVDPSEYTFNEYSGSVTFAMTQDQFAYVFVTLDYPYLRASSYANRLCSDCHTEATHAPQGGGFNCLTCHSAHNTDNVALIREAVDPPYPGTNTKTVVFSRYTGANSFADGDATYDGICEVCHTQTKYHTRDGSGFVNHSSGVNQSGNDCTACHSHASGFSKRW